MGDFKAGETFQDAIHIIDTATGLAAAGLGAVTCTWVKIADNTRTAGTVQEVGSGWYRVTDFTPLVAGAYVTEWAAGAPGYTIFGNYKLFKTGGGSIADVATLVDAATSSRAAAATALSTAQWTNGRAGYLDNINQAGLLQVTAARAAYLDNVNQVGLLQATEARVKGLDNLDAAVSTRLAAAAYTAERGTDNAALAATALSTATWTNARAGYLDRFQGHVVTRMWPSEPLETVDLHAIAANEAMPSVVLPNITGTIVAVYPAFNFCMKEATAAGVIGVDGAQHIQVKESAAGAYVDAISIVDHMFSIADSTREGGTMIMGDHDISAQVAAFNKTYDFQWTSGKAHADHLRFSTVQTFLIVSYY